MEFHQYRELVTKSGFATREILSAFDSAVKFDFEFSPKEEISIDESLIALPYDVVLVRLRLEGAHLFLWCNKTMDDAIAAHGVCAFSDGHMNMCLFKIHKDMRVENIGPLVPVPYGLWHVEDDFSVIENRAQALGAFLTLLNQPDQKIEEYLPSKKLNRKRLANGKPPLIGFKILKIVKPSHVVATRNLGGTHASPRLHLRRGHFRFVHGRSVWIRPALVGDKERGLVLKDYLVHDGRREAAA